MARRIILLLLVVVLGIALLYISRFWPVQLWSRPGLFGLSELPPQGGLLGRWLRGTPFAPFELLIWVMWVFALLSGLQWIADKLRRDP